jgi:hypothetical protein
MQVFLKLLAVRGRQDLESNVLINVEPVVLFFLGISMAVAEPAPIQYRQTGNLAEPLPTH